MTWRTWIWRGPFSVWFIVLNLPVLALLIPILLTEDDRTGMIVGTSIIVGSFLLMAVMHTWLRINPGNVRFGFFPFYWKTLQRSEVRYVIRVEFQPMRDFAGWGLRGLAKSRNGILLGGNPPHGIMFETHDRRRYVLSFVDPDPILQRLAADGYTVTDTPLIDDTSTTDERQ